MKLSQIMLFVIGLLTGAWLVTQFSPEVPMFGTVFTLLFSLGLGLLIVHTVILLAEVAWYHLKDKITYNDISIFVFLIGFFLMFCGGMYLIEGDTKSLILWMSAGFVICLIASAKALIFLFSLLKAMLFGMNVPNSK